MKTHNELTDDEGTRWEFGYDAASTYDGTTYVSTAVYDFRYRKVGEENWLTLPPWADVAEPWKINLCLFDEDEETGELDFWDVSSAPREVPA